MVDSILQELRGDEAFMRQVSEWHTVPANDAQYAAMPAGLHPGVVNALAARGIRQLYSHQASSITATLAGKNVVVVTPTASGKTLCYNAPVASAVINDPNTRALYLFPTKALSQDQQSEINELVASGDLPLRAVTYDGDTPVATRSKARGNAHIIVSNPDMLHSGILPNHTKWVQFLQNLRYVVIDELHSYRGIFGSHVTNVLRRLKRIAAFYGSTPTFILCSATIGNPQELAEAVIEAPVELVNDNGAPRGAQHFVLYNPPLVDRVQGIRRGVVHSASRLAVRLLRQGIKTIVFARSRQRTELIASYIRERLANVYTDNARIKVESYRGGYLPNERRAIERGLREGEIHGVVSTNALELGIDIGGLDAAVLAGFPGTISSSLQQSGRAGRRSHTSLSVLIATSSPLDQFVVEHPEYFLSTNPERAFVNADNPYVLFDHMKCAVFELPFDGNEPFGADAAAVLQHLEESGVIRRSGQRYHWADQSFPAEQVGLRSASSDNVTIIDRTGGRDVVIGEMDRPSAKEMVFTNAIYIHRGVQYVVIDLDIDNRRCYVERSDVNYFTDSLVKVDLKVLEEDERAERFGAQVVVGDVLVRSQVSRFKKIRFSTHENIGYGEIDVPEEQMHTRAIMVALPPQSAAGRALEQLEAAARPIALRRAAGLLRQVAPAFLMSVPQDLGVHAAVRDPHFEAPVIALYDRYPGGSGLAEALAQRFDQVLHAAAQRVERCSCSDGCPSCVGPPDANDGWSGSPKTATRALLDRWLER